MAYITDSWAEIDAKCSAGLAPTSYALGDLKTITLDWGGTTESIDMEIIGFSHDDLADGTGKAAITFFSKQLLSTYRKMASSNNNTGGWAGSYSLHSWCNSTLLVALPADLQAVIREVTKLSDGGQNSTELVATSDKCWLMSATELGIYGGLTTLEGQGVAYSGISSISKAKMDGTAYHYWLRSSTTNNYRWGFVSSWGSVSYDNAANAFGVAFGFCIGSVEVSETKTRGYLVRSAATLYTVTDGTLTALDTTDLTAETFQTYGVDDLPDSSLLVGLTDPEVLYWHDSTDNLPVLTAAVTGTPPVPQVVTSEPQDLTHETITGISYAEVTASEDVRFAVSFDAGVSWIAHDGAAWHTVTDEAPGMTAETFNAITAEQWAEVVALESYLVRFWLPNTTAYVTSVVVHYINP